MSVMEAAEIEPASSGSDEDSEGESDLRAQWLAEFAAEPCHEVEPQTER
jgi:hypothetical protein